MMWTDQTCLFVKLHQTSKGKEKLHE
ncbi:uncharacterized protein METZ01_LOCUS282997, partial [marine metagenome]